MTHLIVDFTNLAFRVKHITGGDADLKGGMAIHICFNSLAKLWREFNGTHIVIALEGPRSWRKKVSVEYKAHREVQRNLRTPREQEDDEIFFEYINEFTKFLHEKTNVTVLQVEGCEADDLIARWIQLHPDEEHVILSSDSDFYQLIAPNVKMYNGIKNETITLDGIFDDNGEQIIDKKTNNPATGPNPEWELFKKIMKGDPGDNVLRACQKGLRETKLKEAFDDRFVKGFTWNNTMLSAWKDHNDIEKTVLERYKFNEILVDLSKQPDEIKERMDKSILEAIQKPKVNNVGIWLMKFCHEYNLQKIEQFSKKYIPMLTASYSIQNSEEINA